MLVSVVVRTRDEADRLRLSLASLSRQALPAGVTAEVIVVDDGSADRTAALLEEEGRLWPVRAIRNESSQGRSAASNTGARAALGEVLLFMDGDALAAPDLVARHAARHREGRLAVRGETWHLRCTRFFRDPETGAPIPGCEEHVRRMGAERERSLVPRDQVLHDFAEVERRGLPAIYPGAGPRRLYELEMDALLHHPNLGVLWMASSGQNLSVPRDDFLAVGGFDERLTLNEHREMALRLCRRGIRMAAAPGARSYHLTHRVGWRDPLVETDWERVFTEKHPGPAVRLMTLLWRSLASDPAVAPGDRILSLPQLEEVLRREEEAGG
jgi:glycosyltransferase involved in cell wall biosynthesis